MSTKIHEDGEGGAAPAGACSTGSVGNTPGTDTGWGVNPPKSKKMVRRKVTVKEFFGIEVSEPALDEDDLDESMTDLQKKVAMARLASRNTARRAQVNQNGSHNERLAQQKDDEAKAKKYGVNEATHVMKQDVKYNSGILASGTALEKVQDSNKLYRVLAGKHKGTIKTIEHAHVQAVTECEIFEAVNKDDPISKEYDALKKHDIKTLRGMIRQQNRIIDTSEFRTKDHAISHYLRSKHGNRKVAAAFGLKECELDEAIKGWKHAHSDLMANRAAASAAGNPVVLHQLRADGKESGMHDARKSFKTEDEAHAHIENIKKLNPSRRFRYNKYLGGQHVGIVESESTDDHVEECTNMDVPDFFKIKTFAEAYGDVKYGLGKKPEHVKAANNASGNALIKKIKDIAAKHHAAIDAEDYDAADKHEADLKLHRAMLATHPAFKVEEECNETILYKQKLAHIRVDPTSKTDKSLLGKIGIFGNKDDLSDDDNYNKAVADAHAYGKDKFGGHYEVTHMDPRNHTIRAGSVAKVRREMKNVSEGDLMAESKTTSDDAFDKLKAAGAKNIKTTSVAIHYNHPKTGESMKLRHRDEEDGVRRVKVGDLNDHLEMLKEEETVDHATEHKRLSAHASKLSNVAYQASKTARESRTKKNLQAAAQAHGAAMAAHDAAHSYGSKHGVHYGENRQGWEHSVTSDSFRSAALRTDEGQEMSLEDLDQITEAAEVQGADRYESTHGQKPKGFGNWYFSKHKSIDFDKHKEGEDHISVRGTYGDAKKQAVKWAKEKGHAVIHVQT